jgi:hypothetical protein
LAIGFDFFQNDLVLLNILAIFDVFSRQMLDDLGFFFLAKIIQQLFDTFKKASILSDSLNGFLHRERQLIRELVWIERTSWRPEAFPLLVRHEHPGWHVAAMHTVLLVVFDEIFNLKIILRLIFTFLIFDGRSTCRRLISKKGLIFDHKLALLRRFSCRPDGAEFWLRLETLDLFFAEFLIWHLGGGVHVETLVLFIFIVELVGSWTFDMALQKLELFEFKELLIFRWIDVLHKV